MTKTPILRTKPSTEVHKEFDTAIKDVLAQFKDRLSATDMLAVSSHLVGVLIAAQDQSKITPAMAMDIVARNIERGNLDAIASLSKTEGTA